MLSWNCLWIVMYELLSTFCCLHFVFYECCLWIVIYKLLSGNCCPWIVLYELLSMNCSLWIVVYELFSMNCCLWIVFYELLSMNCWLWIVVNKLLSINYSVCLGIVVTMIFLPMNCYLILKMLCIWVALFWSYLQKVSISCCELTFPL